jgi:putative ABC transport system permease protein
VVGVVRQPRLYEVHHDDRPQVFLPFAQQPSLSVTLVLRAAEPARLAGALRQAVWEHDPGQPVAAVQPMEQIVGESLAQRRLSMLLLGAFAAVALLLAAIGIYGVMAYVVGQRTQEIGIRMALGARLGDILRMVVGQGLRLAAAGVALGLGGAFGFARLLTTQLYGVSPTDPATFAAASAALVVIALASSYLPARRALRIDPAAALRRE